MKVSTVVSSNVSSHKSATPCPFFFFCLKSLPSSSCSLYLPRPHIFVVLPLAFSTMRPVSRLSVSLVTLFYTCMCSHDASCCRHPIGPIQILFTDGASISYCSSLFLLLSRRYRLEVLHRDPLLIKVLPRVLVNQSSSNQIPFFGSYLHKVLGQWDIRPQNIQKEFEAGKVSAQQSNHSKIPRSESRF